MSTAVLITRMLFALAIIFCFVRLLRASSMLDRWLAIDMGSLLVIALLLLEDTGSPSHAMWAPAVLLSLISFIATIALARLLENYERSDPS